MVLTALVTGADRGLGSALCAELLAQGWRVLAGQYMPDWLELAALAEQYPGLMHIVPLDVGSTASVQGAARRVVEFLWSSTVLRLSGAAEHSHVQGLPGHRCWWPLGSSPRGMLPD